jgi:hypothetical protein
VSTIAQSGRTGIFFAGEITSGVSLFAVSGAAETDGVVSTGDAFRLAATCFTVAFFEGLAVALCSWDCGFVADFLASTGIDCTAAGRET